MESSQGSQGIYNYTYKPNEFSWANYTITLNVNKTYQYVCQSYVDNEDNDWRGAYYLVDGTYTFDGINYEFNGTKAVTQSASTGYNSELKEYNAPKMTGKRDGQNILIKFGNSETQMLYVKETKKLAAPGVVYSDRMFS